MDGYSRLVAWLKVLLPLAALALLSTLFLLSQGTETVTELPFADRELRDRVSSEQISGPFFSGTTRAGDRVSVNAERMRTGSNSGTEAEAVTAQFDLTTGTRINLSADSASIDNRAATALLDGNVVITTSTDIRATTESVTANLDDLVVETASAVQATSPIGDLNAGQMRIEQRDQDKATYLIFTNGVKLVYDPQTAQSD